MWTVVLIVWLYCFGFVSLGVDYCMDCRCGGLACFAAVVNVLFGCDRL